MEGALKKCLTDHSPQCPVSELTLSNIESVLPRFQNALINLEAARKNQIKKNKEYIELQRKAKIYISHFIQVLNFAIVRGEIKKEVREYFDLQQYNDNLPPLNSEKNILEWGKKLIDGDQKRLLKGGSPIYNPSIALVKVNYEKFTDAYYFQKNLISISRRAAKLANEIRPEVDKIILQTWNEIKNYFSGESEQIKRQKSSEYGIIYILRKHEKLKVLKKENPEPQKTIITLNPKETAPEKNKENRMADDFKYSGIPKPVQSVINF